mgnify:FL=1
MIPQFNGLSKILLGIYGSLIATLIVFNFIGADLYLNWEVTSVLKKEVFNYLTFGKGLFQLDIPSKAYFINEFFQGGNIEASTAISWTLNLFIWIFFCGLLAFSTYLKRFGFIVFSSMTLLFINYIDLDSVGIFGSHLGSKWITLIWIFICLGPTYYFHAFNSKPSFQTKWFILVLITVSFLALCLSENPQFLEGFIAGSHLGIATLTFIFICFIGEEILFALLYILTQTRGSANNLKHLIIFSTLYLGGLGLFWATQAGLLNFNFDIINPLYLFICSAIISILTIHYKQKILNKILQQEFDITWLFFLLGCIALSYFNLGLTHGNDPTYDGMSYLILYAHLAFGFMFILYLIFNFIDPLVGGMQVYKIVFIDRNFPYISSKLGGLIVMLAFFLIANKGPYQKLVAAEYNYMGNFHQKAGDSPLAVTYYKQGNVFDWDNHYSNYSLAKYYAKKNNFEEYVYRYYRATKKNETPFAYLNLAQAYVKNGEPVRSLRLLNEGLANFPNSAEIRNNLAIQHFNNGNLKSAKKIINEAGPTDKWNHAIEVNKSFMNFYELDRTTFEVAPLPVKTNMLGGQLKAGLTFDPQLEPIQFTAMNLHSLSLLINANLMGDQTTLHIISDTLLQKMESGHWNRAILESQALGLYRTGYINQAFRKFDILLTLSNNSEKVIILEMMGKIALQNYAPKLALKLFSRSKMYGNLKGDYYLLIAALESQNWSLAKLSLNTLMEKDSAEFPLSRRINDIIKGQSDESVAFFYYRPETLEWDNASLLSSFDTLDLQVIWEKYRQQLFSAGRIDKIKEPHEDLLPLLSDTSKYLYINNLPPHAKELDINENAFDELEIINRVNETDTDLNFIYNLLVESIEINPYSIPLLKAYCFTSIKMGLQEYADSGYMRLMELLSTQEMNTFTESYYDAQQLQKSQSSAWR